MTDSTARAASDELSPYQELQNERLVATAQALHDRKMATNPEGCAQSVALIINLTTGRQLTDQRVSHLLTSLSNEHHGAPLRHTGTTDLVHPEKSETGEVRRGDLTVFCDTVVAEPQVHVGIASALDKHHGVAAVLSNSTHASAFVQTVPGFKDSVRLEHYRLPATPESVSYMLHHVPRLPGAIALDSTHCTVHALDRSTPRTIDVPPREYTNPKDGWQMPGLARAGDGSIAPSADNEFRSITLREGIYQAEHGHVFKYEFPAKAGHDPVAAAQNETLKRAVFSHLPADLQTHYRDVMKLDGPTSNEVRSEVGALGDHEVKEAVNRIQLAIERAEHGGAPVESFDARPPAIGAKQAEKLNELMHEAVARHTRSAMNGVSSGGVAIVPAPPNFTYSGRVDSVDAQKGTFVLAGGRNENQAFEVRADRVGGTLPAAGDQIAVRPGAIEPAHRPNPVAPSFAR